MRCRSGMNRRQRRQKTVPRSWCSHTKDTRSDCVMYGGVRRKKVFWRQLEIGVQSTNDATIQEVSRTMRLDRLAKAVHTVNVGHNIHQHLDLIAGLPYEDYDRFRQSFNDVYQMEPEQLQLGFLKVLKGSRMYDMAETYGIVYRKKAPYEVLKTDWMSYDDILKLKGVEEMVEIYYNSHQFEQSVTYLMHFYKAPFDFFEDLAAE